MKLSTGWEQAIYILLILNQLPRQSVSNDIYRFKQAT